MAGGEAALAADLITAWKPSREAALAADLITASRLAQTSATRSHQPDSSIAETGTHGVQLISWLLARPPQKMQKFEVVIKLAANAASLRTTLGSPGRLQ